MLAKDVMTKKVVSVTPETHVREVAKSLLENRISAVPVVDASGKLLGIVSEGDLMRRSETDTERHSSWWLALVSSPADRALDYVKSHGVNAADVMTRDVISIDEDAALADVADILERNHIKRVPVVVGDELAGIVSRADLLRGFATQSLTDGGAPTTDRELREAVETSISQSGAGTILISTLVADGVVTLWGATNSDAEKQAIRVAAETVSGVKRVEDKIGVFPPSIQAVMWAE